MNIRYVGLSRSAHSFSVRPYAGRRVEAPLQNLRPPFEADGDELARVLSDIEHRRAGLADKKPSSSIVGTWLK